MGTASVLLLEVLITLVLSYRPQFVRTYICCMNFMSQTDRDNERTEYHGLSLQDRVCLPFSFAYTLEIWCEYYYRNNSLS
jgi:PIN domain nuclease of toxin-antitoxin system